MKTILVLLFLALNYVGFGQLIDPFGKVKVHEIKMNKNEDGTYMGAIEWTTGGIDSLQRYIVRGLDVKAPVMVRIISKAPDHNINLSFHKTAWDKPESNIATNGDKFADKIFRTMNIAGLGVSSKVAGIPYLIIVRVGLQFPATKSFIRITDDKEEYARYLKKTGYKGALSGVNNSDTDHLGSTNTNSQNNDSLMYIIIGLLSVIVVLGLIFLLKKRASKTITLLILFLGLSQVIIAQEPAPRNIPLAEQSDVFIGYRTQNVENQVPIDYDNPGLTPAQDRTAYVTNDGGKTYAPIRLEPNPGSIELSGPEAEEIERRMRTDREEFEREYRDNMPGEETEGDQRTVSPNQNREELEQLRRQVRQLQRRVDLLSREDEEFEEQDNNGGEELLVFCDQCQACLNERVMEFSAYTEYLHYLQNFYTSEMTSINDQIAHGNSIASIPGAGLGWGNILLHVIRPAVDELKEAYSDKFDYYIGVLETKIVEIIACTATSTDSDQINQTVVMQNYLWERVNSLKALKINI